MFRASDLFANTIEAKACLVRLARAGFTGVSATVLAVSFQSNETTSASLWPYATHNQSSTSGAIIGSPCRVGNLVPQNLREERKLNRFNRLLIARSVFPSSS